MRARSLLMLTTSALVAVACRSGTPPPPPAPSATAPLTSDAAACVAAVADHQRTVAAHLDAARARTSARDGSGCLAELDAYDRDAWSPTPSTNPGSAMALSRAMCMMLAGDCTGGKTLYRAAMAATAGATLGPEMLSKSVDAIAGMYCQGGALEPRDELLKALMDLNRGAYMTTTPSAECQTAIDTAKRLIPVVQPQASDDAQIAHAAATVKVAGPECLARAGDCEAAWEVFHDAWLAERAYDEATLQKMFTNVVRRCSDR